MKIEIPELAELQESQAWMRKALEKLIEQNERLTVQVQKLISNKAFYSVKEFAEQTGMTYTTVQKKIYKQEIKAEQKFRSATDKRGKWMIPATELIRLTA